MKTLVVAQHGHEVGPNGHNGCFARWGNHGLCPGIKTADWLNGLGEDDEFYVKPSKANPEGITNGRVRANWLRENTHVIAIDPEMARLTSERTRAKQSLSRIDREIKALKKNRAAAEKPLA